MNGMGRGEGIFWQFEHQNAAPHGGQAKAVFRLSYVEWTVLKVDFMLTHRPLCWWKERFLPKAGRRDSDAIPKVGWLRDCHALRAACSQGETILLSSAISMLFRELQIPCRKVVVIKVNFTGNGHKSLQAGCYFSQLGSCGAAAKAG